jgi:hypothetical protein
MAATDNDHVEFLGIEHGLGQTLNFSFSPLHGLTQVSLWQAFGVDEVELFLSRILRGMAEPWSLGTQPDDISRFLDASTRHGLDALLHERAGSWPVAVQEPLRASGLAWAIWDQQHRHWLAKAIDDLAAANIECLLFKGAVTAHSLYPSAHLRPRSDSDLLIRPSDRRVAGEVLRAAGWELHGVIECEHLGYECSFVRCEAHVQHVLDLHWRIHYSHTQCSPLSWDRLRQVAVGLPTLSPHALAAGPAHNFVITSIHRANDLHLPQWTRQGATFGGDRWIVLHDIALMLRNLDAASRVALADEAIRCGAAGVCLDAVTATADLLDLHLLPGVDELLERLQQQASRDVVRRYHSLPVMRQRWQDLRSLHSSRERAAWAWEHVFPPAAYIRHRYPERTDPVIVLQARRLLDGWRRWTSYDAGRLSRR